MSSFSYLDERITYTPYKKYRESIKKLKMDISNADYDKLTHAQKYELENPLPYTNQESFNKYMIQFGPLIPNIPPTIQTPKKEDYEIWPLQFPEKVLINEFKKNIKEGRELIYNNYTKIFTMIKEKNPALHHEEQLNKAKEYVSELATFCSKIPEWSWKDKNLYIIRGFLTREECHDELNGKKEGTFIICIRDEPSAGFMIACRISNDVVMFIKVDYDNNTFSITDKKYPSLSECILNYSPLQNIQISSSGIQVDYRKLAEEKGIPQQPPPNQVVAATAAVASHHNQDQVQPVAATNTAHSSANLLASTVKPKQPKSVVFANQTGRPLTTVRMYQREPEPSPVVTKYTPMKKANELFTSLFNLVEAILEPTNNVAMREKEKKKAKYVKTLFVSFKDIPLYTYDTRSQSDRICTVDFLKDIDKISNLPDNILLLKNKVIELLQTNAMYKKDVIALDKYGHAMREQLIDPFIDNIRGGRRLSNTKKRTLRKRRTHRTKKRTLRKQSKHR